MQKFFRLLLATMFAARSIMCSLAAESDAAHTEFEPSKPDQAYMGRWLI